MAPLNTSISTSSDKEPWLTSSSNISDKWANGSITWDNIAGSFGNLTEGWKDALLNCSSSPGTPDPCSGGHHSECCGEDERAASRLHEFQIIKAVVLMGVTSVLLLSVCRMVLQLFVRYTVVGKHDK